MPMWFSPGILLAAIYALIVFWLTGSCSQWWLWLTAVLGGIVIDAMLGITPKRKVKVKRVTEYEKE